MITNTGSGLRTNRRAPGRVHASSVVASLPDHLGVLQARPDRPRRVGSEIQQNVHKIIGLLYLVLRKDYMDARPLQAPQSPRTCRTAIPFFRRNLLRIRSWRFRAFFGVIYSEKKYSENFSRNALVWRRRGERSERRVGTASGASGKRRIIASAHGKRRIIALKWVCR